MLERERILDRVRAVLTAGGGTRSVGAPIEMNIDASSVLTLKGELASVAAKKLTLERAAAVEGVSAIIDRLHVVPANPEGDGEIRDHVRDTLLQEPAFQELTLRIWVKGQVETVREPDTSSGVIEVRVENGVVTLDGEVLSLSHKRLAGVLAWWVPSCRDVINGLGVEPPEEDNDDEIADGLRLALEKDPFVDASQVRIMVRNAVVRLTGYVPTVGERDAAELDAWFIFGVDKVINHIEVAG